MIDDLVGTAEAAYVHCTLSALGCAALVCSHTMVHVQSVCRCIVHTEARTAMVVFVCLVHGWHFDRACTAAVHVSDTVSCSAHLRHPSSAQTLKSKHCNFCMEPAHRSKRPMSLSVAFDRRFLVSVYIRTVGTAALRPTPSRLLTTGGHCSGQQCPRGSRGTHRPQSSSSHQAVTCKCLLMWTPTADVVPQPHDTAIWDDDQLLP